MSEQMHCLLVCSESS